MYLQPSNGKKSKKKKFSLSILPETMDAMATKQRMSVRAISNLAMLLLVSALYRRTIPPKTLKSYIGDKDRPLTNQKRRHFLVVSCQTCLFDILHNMIINN